MGKGQQVYLISFALVLLAGILLYDLYKTPEFSPAVVNKTAGISSASEQAAVSTNTDANKEAQPPPAKSKKEEFSGTVNINTASVQELMSLDGIGETKAKAIIEYRMENGAFGSTDELLNVNGIGPKTLDKIRSRITV